MNPSLSQELNQARDKEVKILKIFVGISLGIHALVFFVGPLPRFFSKPIEIDEWVVETELVQEASKQESIAHVKPAADFKVSETMLPQLPKDVKINPEEVIDDVKKEVVSEAVKKPDVDDDTPKLPAEEDEKKNEKKPEPKAAEDVKKVEDVAKDKEKAEAQKHEEEKQKIEEMKRIALERILKEKARLDKKLDKETVSPLDKTLRERKEALESKLGKSYILLSGKRSSGDAYAGILKGWIMRRYSLPEIYNLRNMKIKAAVQLVLEANGAAREINLAESSGDPAFDRLALDTLRSSSPFPKPPQEWVGKVITFPFETAQKVE